jgi:very-short-patch-repair endonuclease
VSRALRKRGWKVVRIWEHELAKNPVRCINIIKGLL